MAASRKAKLGWLALAVVLLGVGYWGWTSLTGDALPDGIGKGNGRIEATEIDVAAKLAGRIEDIYFREGDFVEAGTIVARMDTSTLEAQLREAQAQLKQAEIAIGISKLEVEQREAELRAAEAIVSQRTIEQENAQKRLERSSTLQKRGVTSEQVRDDDEAVFEGARAAVSGAQAEVAARKSAVMAAQAGIINAEAAVEAARATIERIQSDIDDSELKATRSGRIQYRIAQPGEVVAAGGRVLNLVDLGDVYMTFFLPTAESGRVPIGAEARIILDAAPNIVIPANISFVSDVAQFTPKTVETAEERAKLMFRLRAQVPQELLKEYITQVKTGLPGVAYVKLSGGAEWPAFLQTTVVE